MNETGSIRSFLAVNPSDQLRSELTRRLDALKVRLTGCPGFRWTRPDQWHLTMQFLGDWPEPRLDRLAAALSRCQDLRGFQLNSAGLGAFPHLKKPRVLFLHLDSGNRAEELARVLRENVDAVWPEGPQDRRAFRAHLTLARVKQRLAPEDLALLAGLDLRGLPGTAVRELHLVGSLLQPTGARHSIRASFPLPV